MNKVLLDKIYYCEELNDVERDVYECLDDDDIETDEHGFSKGKYTVIVIYDE